MILIPTTLSGRFTSHPYYHALSALSALVAVISRGLFTMLPLNAALLKRHACAAPRCNLSCLAIGLLFGMRRDAFYLTSLRLMVDHRNLQITQGKSFHTVSALTGPIVDGDVKLLRAQRILTRALALAARLTSAVFQPPAGWLVRVKHRLAEQYTFHERKCAILARHHRPREPYLLRFNSEDHSKRGRGSSHSSSARSAVPLHQVFIRCCLASFVELAARSAAQDVSHTHAPRSCKISSWRKV